ncbi:MAG: hypothetical protein ABEI99_11355 [Halobaculum sp.]
MAGATVEFVFTDPGAERRFVETYLADAFDRFTDSDYWDHGWFWPYGQTAAYDAGPDGGFLRLVFDGDPDALIAAESDRWNSVDGLTDWSCRQYDDPEAVDTTFDSLLAQQQSAKGDVGGEWEYRFKRLTAEFALAYRQVFEEPLPAAPDPDDDNPGIGAWALLHDLLVQCGYDWYDETDACLRAMQNRLKSVAAYQGADAAREEYERIRSAWADHEAELESWLADNPTGEASVE